MSDYLFEYPNFTEGYDSGFVDLATEIPSFPIMMLVATYMIIFLGGMASQLKRSGYADAPLWSTLSFLVITVMALIMSTTLGIINPLVLATIIGGTFFSALWLFLSQGRFEN